MLPRLVKQREAGATDWEAVHNHEGRQNHDVGEDATE